jgi:HD-GYP domain-containing protein (c-di-GMP phosphodiesterase class II)
VLYHHERWDGEGYPYQKKGEDIPLFARILAVADAYDAMLSERNYRKRKTHIQACEEIIQNKGTQFDPEIVDAFLKLPSERLKF